MGTASQSLASGDPSEKQAIDELLKMINAPGFSKKKKAGLDQVFGEIINGVLFGKDGDAETKRRVEQAVQGPIMDQIIRPYLEWKSAGSKASKWPFRKKPEPSPHR